jgi:hypothetical protein
MKGYAYLVLLLALVPELSDAQVFLPSCRDSSVTSKPELLAELLNRHEAESEGRDSQAWNLSALAASDKDLEVVGQRWDAVRQLMLLRVRARETTSPPFVVWRKCDPNCAARLECKAIPLMRGRREAPLQQHRSARLAAGTVLVTRGQQTTAVLERRGLKIALQAVSLDRGQAGDAVRLRLQHGGRVLRGEIIGPGLVALELPRKRETTP